MENMLESLKCCIHLEILEDPVTLPCGHNFCLSCATSCIKNNTIKCPLDQKLHILPNGKDSLVINWALKDLTNKLNLDCNNENSIKKMIIETYSSSDSSDSSDCLEITEMTPIQNSSLKHKFNNKKKIIKGLNNVLIKLHGTSLMAAKGIASTGFAIPSSFKRSSQKEGCLNFGKAIYLSSFSSKTISYCTSSNPVIVVCQVLLGKVKTEEESREKLTAEIVNSEGYDTIYCSHTLSNSEINKGTCNDEYAIYDSAQILPIYIIQYKIRGLSERKEFMEYIPNLSMKDIDFSILFLLLQKGSNIQKKNILLTLAELCRDFNNSMTKIIIQYFQQFFSSFNNFLKSNDENLILTAERVLWNSSYNNRFIQKLIFDNIPVKSIFYQLLKSASLSIKERSAGVLVNLTSLESDNSKQISKLHEFEKLFKMALLSYEKKKFVVCETILTVIANVLEYDKTCCESSFVLDELLDSPIENVKCQCNRIFCNIIGYEKEWLIQGYKPTLALDKI